MYSKLLVTKITYAVIFIISMARTFKLEICFLSIYILTQIEKAETMVLGCSYLLSRIQALFTFHPNPKYFLFHPSHQIFRRMHGALNVGKKDN